MTVAELRCEYLKDPLGVGRARPRFSWRLTGDVVRQSAYQITVEQIDAGGDVLAVVWDSGRVASQRMQALYAGAPLESRARYRWRVTVEGQSATPSAIPASEAGGGGTATGYFEMGLLDEADWTSGWWSAAGQWSGRSLQFRLPFVVDVALVGARAYICGLGYHVLSVNGSRVADRVLEPAWTEYEARCAYSTYDITKFLTTGDNVAGVTVGNGWHGRPILRAQIELLYADGRREIVSDGDWPWTVSAGPILRNDVLDGETYDARLEQPYWDSPGYVASPLRWIPARADRGPSGRMVSPSMEPIRVVEELAPVSTDEQMNGHNDGRALLFDFGVNMAGWCRLAVRGNAGAVITVEFAETLHDGFPDRENLRTAGARCVYVLRGAPGLASGITPGGDPPGTEVYEPAFCYFGFRYAMVTVSDPATELVSITARRVRSGVARTGAFASDNQQLNLLWEMVVRTEENNLHGLPTDCPQRDERMAWLNDMRVRAECALYAFDLEGLYRKWLDDISDAQDPVSGAVPDTAPYRWGGRRGDPVNCPAELVSLLYRFYGDKRVLTESLALLRGWLRYLDSIAQEGIIRLTHYGDWCPPAEYCFAPDDDPGPDNQEAFLAVGSYPANTPGALVSTAYYYRDLVLVADMCSILGLEEEGDTYRRRAELVKQRFNEEFGRSDGRGFGTGSQGCNALALGLGLVHKEERRSVVAALVSELREKGSLTTGNQATKHLMDVLVAEGYADEALALALRTSYPGWGYMLRRGATTVWERWEELRGPGMNSHNHPMFGSVGAYLVRCVAGLYPDTAEPGWYRFHFRPPVVDGVGRAEMKFESPVGPIATAWVRDRGQLSISVEVPPGATCVLHMADRVGKDTPSETELPPGVHSLTVPCVRKNSAVIMEET